MENSVLTEIILKTEKYRVQISIFWDQSAGKQINAFLQILESSFCYAYKIISPIAGTNASMDM